MRRWAGCLIVTDEGKIALQKRENKPGIMNPGMLTTFGGELEKDESPDEGMRRELIEELEIDPKNYSIEPVSQFWGVPHPAKEDVECYVYILRGVPFSDMHLHEGEAITLLTPEEAIGLSEKEASFMTIRVLAEYCDKTNIETM